MAPGGARDGGELGGQFAGQALEERDELPDIGIDERDAELHTCHDLYRLWQCRH
jgi:hypothetical protein